MKKFLLITTLFISVVAFGQNEVDALRYSTLGFGGTARYNGMNGAFGALGGDVSSGSINPAGIGVFRSSEFTASAAFLSNSTSTNHYGTTANDFKLNLNFNNWGYVWAIDVSEGNVRGWQRVNLGFGYNRLANFHNRYHLEGENLNSSIIDQWVRTLNQNGGVDASTINDNSTYYQGPYLAWQTYLIDYDTSANSNPYYSALKQYGQTQSMTQIEKGTIGETFFSVGANYSNKLYLGVSLTTDKIKHSSETVYSETTSDFDTISHLSDFSLNETISTEGRGYNAKIGVIYRPIDYLRLGASVQTPTIYSMSDSWVTDLESNFDTISFYFSDPSGRYDYILITPYRATFSAAVQVGKLGLISADYEIVNYSSARLQSENGDYDFVAENNAIKTNYTTSGNLKIGTEWRLNEFRIRAGYGYFGNPMQSDLTMSKAYHTYSGGLGYKNKDFFADIAYNFTMKSGEIYLYNDADLASSETSNKIHRVTATVGFRF